MEKLEKHQYFSVEKSALTLNILSENSADDKVMIYFLFFQENRIWYFMQIVSLGDNLHEMSVPRK